MKEGRIFEYTMEHIPVFRSLFEILSGVLHELVMIHIKPPKPIDAEKQDDSDKEKSESDSESNSDSDNDAKLKSSEKLAKKNTKVIQKSNKKSVKDSDSESNYDSNSDSESDSDSDSKSNKKIIKKQNTDSDKSDKSDKSQKDEKEDNDKMQGGIKIVEVNDFESIIIIIRLYANNFFKFDSKKPKYSIGLDPTTMFNVLKNIDKNGQMTVYVNEATKQTINIELQNNEKKSKESYDFKLMDLDERKITPLPPEFDIIVEMKTEDFHNMCKNLLTYGQFVIIECTDKKIEFKCKGSSGNLGTARKEFEHDPNGEDGTVNIKVHPKKNKNEPIIIREIYDLNDICLFQKCKTLSTNIQILLKNEYIMFIRYEIASYGVMNVGFNPANENLVNKHANYDNNKFDPFYKTTEVKYKS
jgi:proliferating cell nuclear antigen PCNA